MKKIIRNPPRWPTQEEWLRAKDLFSQQLSLRSKLSSILASSPTSGLFVDEDVNSFPSFVRHVQTSLALSPKTVLRHAVDNSFARLWRKDPEQLGELYDILGLTQENGNSIVMLSEAMGRLSGGRLYSKLCSAISASKKQSLYTEDSVEFQRRMVNGLRAKNRGNKEPSPEEIDSAVKNALERGKGRRQMAAQMVKKLEAQLPTDKEYLDFKRAQHLWNTTGAKTLWDDYNKVNQEEGRERRLRGGNFEEEFSAICFATIVNILQPSLGHPISSFTYVQNALWFDGENNQTGEIDLVVMCNGGAVAICEMKAGCFEIASAIAQHEAKLKQALPRNDMDNEKKPRILIRSPEKDTTIPFAPVERQIGDPLPLFVLTMLPTGPVLGAEPALSHAICEGIRAQGLNVRGSSTASVLQTLTLSDLLQSGLSRSTVRKHLMDEVEQNGDAKDQTINMVTLEKYVRAKMGPVRLGESPGACLDRYGEHIIVLPPMD